METVETEQLKGKNWLATMMLAWAFGIYGAHRFYTGKQGSAWAMAILSFFGCGLIITLPWMAVDLIMIALGNWRHEDGSELYERIPWLGYTLLVFVILGIILAVLYFGAIAAVVTSAITSGAGAGAGTVAPATGF